MKTLKKSLLSVALIGCVLPLAACSVDAEPHNIDDKFITFSDTSKDYFRDTYEYLWDNYTNGGSTSSTVLNEVINKIAKIELVKFFGTQEKLDAEITKLCKKKLIEKVISGSYDVDSIFQEEKLANELRASLYDIKGTEYNNTLILTPEMNVDVTDENFETVYNSIFKCDYADYFEKSYKTDIYKQLLTAQYIAENEFTTLARTYARRVSWIKLENVDKKPMAVSNLVNAWLQEFITTAESGSPVEAKFDLDSLAKIWKGVGDFTSREQYYVDNYYTLNTQLDDEIKKVADISVNPFVMKNDVDLDTTIEDKYTNNGAYTLDWGYTLAQRELAKKSFSGSDLYTKSNGISDLPSDITDRIFSTSLGTSSGYLKQVDYTYGADATADTVYFLTPKNSEATSESTMSKYYHYIDGAYYIVLVDNDTFTTESLKKGCTLDADGNITEYSSDVIALAETLGETSSNQREAVIHYLEEYDIADKIHDDTFYDYLEDNYAELFDD